MIKKLLLIYLYLFAIHSVYSQVTFNYTIKGGNNVKMVFNSFNKLNSGITYSNFTKFSVTYDHPGTSKYWKLICKANTANIIGDGGNNLDLSTIELKPTCSDAGANLYNMKLSSSDITLIDNGGEGTNITITITYEIGVDSNYKLFDKKPDEYFVDIIFWFEYDN